MRFEYNSREIVYLKIITMFLGQTELKKQTKRRYFQLILKPRLIERVTQSMEVCDELNARGAMIAI